MKDREKRRGDQERGPEELSLTQLSAGVSLGLGTNLESFDEKLRHIRACSPRTRRRMAAETLQWQAAIATVEAEGLAPTPAAPAPAPIRNAANNDPIQAPRNDHTPMPPFSASLAAFAAPATLTSPAAAYGAVSYGAEPTYEPMEEDESESEEEEGLYDVSMIKAPR